MEFYYDRTDRDVLVLSVDGGLMADNSVRFVGELERYVDLGVRKLIVDCSRLTKISSHGLGVLLGLRKRLARQGGAVKLANVGGYVGKIISLTGTGAMLEIYPTVDDARQAFGCTDDAGEGPGCDSGHPLLD